ncbi:class I adenylate-forming enzyme family protein [Rhodococcus sp. ACPA1]|uniref:class I adenylate-forming enzyme family protein n=1 Tax=Rhodococcus sp. ACPA1 TaxID=2028572 RepID=UPI000BB1080C|nr:long-chain fatty acid--CoA ligase [Rhodococcus sp. ACPA1]PBC47175.1 AMP-dependent synthetase [Rhodococcus sp. ACPA1]
MSIAQLLADAARRDPDAIAWKYADREASYSQFVLQISALADRLRELGLTPGDRVLLCVPNRPELLTVLWATLWAGMVTVPLNSHLHRDEVRYALNDSGARAILVSSETASVLDNIDTTDAGIAVLHAEGLIESLLLPRYPQMPAEAAPTDPAWLFYTSGTTGRPKGATLTHRNLLAMTLHYLADVDSVERGSVFVHAAPLTHGSGLYMLPALARGATNVIYSEPSFDAAKFLDLIEREKVTHAAFLAPTMLRRLITSSGRAPREGSTLRSIVVGGAPMYRADLSVAIEAFGPIITQIYGQGEAPMSITVMPASELVGKEGRGRAERGACGRPFTGVQVRVVDDRDESAPENQDGEVWVQGDVVMRGYWENPEATHKTVHDGWLRTGDIGHLDANGYLYLTDRAKDVIITGGSNVYPREVEEALLTHPAVREVAVIGTPDPEWGESIRAFVVPEDGITVNEQELIAHVRDRLASFKKPRSIEFRTELPKNATGKILKRQLKV